MRRWILLLPIAVLAPVVLLAGLRLGAPEGPLHGTGPRLASGELERREAELVLPRPWLPPGRIAAEEGWLAVPAGRGTAGPSRLRIHYARLAPVDGQGAPRATHGGESTLVLLAGPEHPGASRALVAGDGAALLRLRRLGPLLAFDGRHAMDAEPAPACPGHWPGAELASGEERRRRLEALGRACREALSALPGPPDFGPAADAADLEALRAALGLERLRLVALGDAARTALAYLDRWPRRVERVLVLAPPDPGAAHPDPADVDRALGRVLDALASAPALRGRLPEPRESLRTAVARLDQSPQALTIGGAEVELDGSMLRRLVLDGLRDRAALPVLGKDLAALLEGRVGHLAPRIAALVDAPAPRVATLAASCQRRDGARRDRRQRLRAPFTVLGDIAGTRREALCAGWPRAPEDEETPIAAPILAVAGSLDAVAPMEQAQRLVAMRPGASLLVVEGAGHGRELLAGSAGLEATLHAFLAGADEPVPERLALPPLGAAD